MSDLQMDELATMIQVEYFYFRPEDVLVFFYRLKLGKYGSFYGNVDPMVITSALIEFCQERASEWFIMVNKQEQERAQMQQLERLDLKQRGKLISRSEYRAQLYSDCQEFAALWVWEMVK